MVKESKTMVEISTEARKIHFSTPVVDAHCDTLWRSFVRRRDFSRHQPAGHIDLYKLKEGGIKLQVFAAFVSPSQKYRGFFSFGMGMLKLLQRLASENPDKLCIVKDCKSLDGIMNETSISAVFGIEGAHILEGKVENFYKLYEGGLRLLTLTWNNPNEFADSSAAKSVYGGLSPRGKELVKEMNRLGVVIDLSHSSSDTLKDVLQVSKKPVLVSHSCCRSLCDVHRNLTDEEIKMVAGAGGVIGVNFFPLFLDTVFKDAFFKMEEERLAGFREISRKYRSSPDMARQEKSKLKRTLLSRLPAVPYKRVIDHIEQIISVAGDGCVGLGSDFDGINITPEGLEDVSCLPRLTDEMLKRGLPEITIKKALGLNLLRLFRDVLP